MVASKFETLRVPVAVLESSASMNDAIRAGDRYPVSGDVGGLIALPFNALRISGRLCPGNSLEGSFGREALYPRMEAMEACPCKSLRSFRE